MDCESMHVGQNRGEKPFLLESIAGALRRVAHEGYGLAITTGGVGAEEKDCAIEAVLKLDPSAETRYQERPGRYTV